MSYTLRTKAAILGLTGDNTTALISPQDLRDAIGTLFSSPGGLYTTAGASSQSFNNTYSLVTGWASFFSGAEGMTTLPANDYITPTVDGIYMAFLSLGIQATDGTTFTFQLRKGTSTDIDGGRFRIAGDASLVRNGSLFVPVSLLSTDNVGLYCTSGDVGGKSFTLVDGQFVLLRIS